MSYKLYYVNYEIGLEIYAVDILCESFYLPFRSSLPCFRRPSVLFQMLEFVLKDLLELSRIGSHNAPPIHKQRRRTVHV